MDHGGRFHGTAVSQSGTGAVHPVWGERTGESGKDYQPVSGGGRTKRNDGRKLLEGTDPSDFKDHHLFIPGIASSPVTCITDT